MFIVRLVINLRLFSNTEGRRDKSYITFLGYPSDTRAKIGLDCRLSECLSLKARLRQMANDLKPSINNVTITATLILI